MKKILLTLSFLVLSSVCSYALATKPNCYSSGNGYCQYKGQVSKVYVNAGNIILLYFDEAMAPADAQVAGYTISSGVAGAYKITNNPDFAKMLYSTLLTAKSQNKEVQVQMRGTESGYMKIDRVWIGD